MDCGVGDHQTADQGGVWLLVAGQSQWAPNWTAQPMGCTPALSVTQKAPLQLRYAACGAIYMLYAFIYGFAFD